MLGPFKLSIFLLAALSAYLEPLVHGRRMPLFGATVSTVYFAPLRAGRISLRGCAPFNFESANRSTYTISQSRRRCTSSQNGYARRAPIACGCNFDSCRPGVGGDPLRGNYPR